VTLNSVLESLNALDGGGGKGELASESSFQAKRRGVWETPHDAVYVIALYPALGLSSIDLWSTGKMATTQLWNESVPRKAV